MRDSALELMRKQLVEANGNAIFRRANEAESNVKKGEVKKGSIRGLMKDLKSD